MAASILAAGANAAIYQAPGVANSVSEGIQNAGQAVVDAVQQLPERVQPIPQPDPLEREQ